MTASMKVADFEVFEPSAGFRVCVHPTRKFKTITVALHAHQALDGRATRLALLSSVLRRGCRGTPTTREIVRFLEGLYGASLGSDVAKVGERHLICLRFDVVNDRFAPKKIGALRKALDFLWRMLSQPVRRKGGLHPEFVSQEKENLRRQIQGMINERMSYAWERCVQEMCADEAYSRYEYGRLEEIDRVTPKALAKLHADVLARSPVELYVVGDVEPGRVAEAAGRIFRFGRRKIRTPGPTEIRSGNGELREVTEKIDVEQAKVVLGCRTGITLADPDLFPLGMYNGILGAFPHSKLFANVREREGLAYAVHSSLDQTKGLLFVTAGINPEKVGKCVEVIREQMADVAAGKITEAEWSKTRTTIVDRVRSREDNPSAKIGSFLEMDLNGRVMTAEEIINGLEGVTRDDVVKVAARVRPDTMSTLTRP